MSTRTAALACALLGLAACQAATGGSVARTGLASAPIATFADPPADGTAGQCWGKAGQAPVVDTIEETVLVEPPGLAIDGTLRTEPLTRIETRDAVIVPGSEIWFETLCPDEVTPARLASLQRALTVRGHYSGPVTGTLDAATEAAVRAYQTPLGLESGTLSRAAAERLGLVVTPVESGP
ncbi:MAG: peptidoglycan-binding domain-containing protein [Pseudomonadota bacterium]